MLMERELNALLTLEFILIRTKISLIAGLFFVHFEFK